ncbi:hypothetical protein EJD97_020269 [Solanum chilense]|uniref:Uncharacterized protein n=2 Tax=Solanum subgen. Lycopersicon TaxID=49274 RepID=A0A3Q7GGN5_SOLLC|nr:hypothetical protein EJD97_020269 [Solanum chilense]
MVANCSVLLSTLNGSYSSEKTLMIENFKISVTFMTLLQPIAVDDNWVDSQFGVASSSVFFSMKRCYGVLQKLVQLLKQFSLKMMIWRTKAPPK